MTTRGSIGDAADAGAMIDGMPLLLERDGDRTILHERLAEARAGDGGVVLVSGEAGIGKTTFVRDVLDHVSGVTRTLVGMCDPLVTPRPLGPLIDAARSVAPDLARRLAGGVSRAEAFAAALDLLDEPDGPAVFVLEDLHWADEATLDLFTFLARRVADRPVLVIATFRSDEVDDRHPLRVRFGDIRSHVVARIELEPLSVAAVAELAEQLGTTHVDPAEIHRSTGGNPFFVTEVLASSPSSGEGDTTRSVPATVREAVRARADRLDGDVRAVLDAASIVPGRVERWLLATLCGLPPRDFDDALDTCCGLGLLRISSDGSVEFRHELGRLAIEDSVPVSRSRELHAAALHALRASSAPIDRARLAHHAAGADDGPSVLELAPDAATEASAAGAHREAAALLALAMRYDHLCDPRQLGDLWLRLGRTRVVTGDFAGADDALDRAADVFARDGDDERQAEAMIEQATALGMLGRVSEDLALLDRAAALLGPEPTPSRAAALLESARCTEAMLAREPDPAEHHGQRAMALATEVVDLEVYATAAIQSGIARCVAGDDGGLDRVRRGIEVGRQIGEGSVVAHGLQQIGTGYGEFRRYDVAFPALYDGIEFTGQHELVGTGHYLGAWLARCELETGDWDAAGRRAGALVANPRCVGKARFVAMVTLGWLRMRRGDPDVSGLLDEALEFAREAHHLQRLWPVAAARAEHAWLHDRLADELPLIRDVLELARSYGYPPAIEELSHWLAIAGEAVELPATSARTPFGLSATGAADAAAAAWDERGCPYEAAVARLLAGDPTSMREAHAAFERLGATALLDRTARALRQAGARVPRGPNQSTRDNPHALTDRELDVLALLPSGATNAEIGATLHISTKTAGHHVSRILAKLGVSTRAEAAIEAHRLELD